MKNFEDFNKTDLQQLRSQICLNSIYYADYRNSFGINEQSVCEFFDGYYSYIWEIAEEEHPNLSENEIENIIGQYDNIDTLESWYYCFEDFSWVEYEEDDEE